MMQPFLPTSKGRAMLRNTSSGSHKKNTAYHTKRKSNRTFETLERREMMAADTVAAELHGSTLYVFGTGGDYTIIVGQSNHHVAIDKVKIQLFTTEIVDGEGIEVKADLVDAVDASRV